MNPNEEIVGCMVGVVAGAVRHHVLHAWFVTRRIPNS